MTLLPSQTTLPAPALARSTLSGGSIRTLVVDDSVVMRRLISRMLSSEAQIDVVGSARDGIDALAKIEQLQPDLVTLDVEMPEMNGLEALRLMQVRFPRVRVIMCSSLTERGARITTMRCSPAPAITSPSSTAPSFQRAPMRCCGSTCWRRFVLSFPGPSQPAPRPAPPRSQVSRASPFQG